MSTQVMERMVVEVNGRKAQVEFPAEAGMLSRNIIREAVGALLRGIEKVKLTASTGEHKREVVGGIGRGRMHLE